MIKLKAKDLIDPEKEACIIHHKKLNYWSTVHDHDFYEFFLITHGTVIHLVNGTKQILSSGELVFIRPQDVHSYERFQGEDVGILVINFRKNIIHKILDYLGEGYLPQRLLVSELPPAVQLSPVEITKIMHKYEQVITLPPQASIEFRTAIRVLLSQLFIDYFFPQYETTILEAPPWLNRLYTEMQKKDHFVSGVEALKSLSLVSYEHLCRTLKKHLGITPTAWINQIRINYAANLLVYSHDEIASICLEAGFNNFSYFYSLFQKEFKLSPGKYRNLHRKAIIPQ